jgi:hypothetical protein
MVARRLGRRQAGTPHGDCEPSPAPAPARRDGRGPVTAPEPAAPNRRTLPAALAHLVPAATAVSGALAAGRELVLVDSPPGAGKSTLLTRLAADAACRGQSVLIATCTNNVSADLAVRIRALDAGLPITYVLGKDAPVPAAVAALSGRGLVTVTSDLAAAVRRGGVVVGNATKWNTLPDTPRPVFDIALYDEAYQIPFLRLWPILSLAAAHVAVGDPGQCRPFSEVDTGRWLGSPTSPVAAAAEALAYLHPDAPVVRLDRSLRLLQDTVDVLQPALYPRLPFTGAPAGSRRLVRSVSADVGSAGRAIAALAASSLVAWELPQAAPGAVDAELCAAAAHATGLLADGRTWVCADGKRAAVLRPEDVAVVCARRDQVHVVRAALPGWAGAAAVGTANTLQGLEWPATVSVDPLAGRSRLSEFDLSPGRLSVMMSRGSVATLFLGRAGTGAVLNAHVPVSARALGSDQDDETRGYEAHLGIRAALHRLGRVVR